MANTNTSGQDYWKANLRLLGILLVIWFIFSYVFGIILVDVLNNIHIAGFPLGFWFAQQGAIYSFLIVILLYVIFMNKIDRRFGVREE